MTKTLSDLTYGDILEMHQGNLIAFTPVVCEHGIALGIATANEAGYHPIPASLYCVEEWNTASEEADRLNTLYGHTDTAAARVIASSMAAGKLPKTSQEATA